MKHSTETDINLIHSHDLLEHMPKAFQTMAIIEEKAEARFCEIMASIERGDTTLEEVKRQRGVSDVHQDPVESRLIPRVRGVRHD